jgi:predicted nucleic acid-binding protein
MIVYLDSSILLRRLLGQPRSLREWRLVRTGVSSRIAEVEGLRTLDRLRLQAGLPDDRIASLREGLYHILGSLEIVEVTRAVLTRAAQPSPTIVGTLDAVHLSSALLWRERTGKNLALATHDEALALSARAHGFKTLGT